MSSSAACGTSYVLGTEQLMFVSAPSGVDAEFEGSLCLPGPSNEFDVRSVVEAVYGAGYIPASAGTTSVGLYVDKSTVIGGVVVIVLLALGGIGMMRWRRRQAPE